MIGSREERQATGKIEVNDAYVLSMELVIASQQNVKILQK